MPAPNIRPKLFQLLLECPTDFTAEELSVIFECHVCTIRKHLRSLERDGDVMCVGRVPGAATKLYRYAD